MNCLQHFQRIWQARADSQQRHAQFMREMAGATYRHELKQQQTGEQLRLSLHPTVLTPIVVPSAHTKERHTDKFTLRKLKEEK